MKRRVAFITCTLSWNLALAQATVERAAPPYLPEAAQAIAWIDGDPAVAQARRNLEAAGYGRNMLIASPYEWTARVAAQRREYRDASARSNEWSAQLERPIRINGKAALDRNLGDLEVEISRARVRDVRHEAARALSDLWLDAMAAENLRVLAQEQLGFARRNLDVVERRRRAGDAAVLDVNLARTDLAEVERQASLATTQAAKARAVLAVRFAGALTPNAMAFPPTLPEGSEAEWRERVLSEADTIRVAQAQLQRASVSAQRARADRIADPTIGVFSASEAQRNERLVGVSVSIPLGGEYRSQRMQQALREAEAAEADVERERRKISAEVAAAYVEATGAVQRWQLAEAGAQTARGSADLSQRAYTLGELDLQGLLLVRRQALDASRAALEARMEALRGHARLLIDAHLIWNLSSD